MRHEQNDFIKGALIGSLIGGVIGLLVAPKSGEELRHDIVDGYNSINEKGHNLTDSIRSSGRRLFSAFEEEEEAGHDYGTLVKGGAIGAVIAAIAALLLAPQSGTKLRNALGETYEDIREKAEDFVTDFNEKKDHVYEEVGDWKDTLVTLVNKLSAYKGKKGQHSKLEDIADLASFGLRLYQQLQHRR